MNKTIFRSLLAVSLIATLLMAGCQKDYTTLRVRIDNFGGNSKVYMGSVGNSNIRNIPMWSQLSGYYDTIWIDHGYNADHSYILDEFNTRQGVDYAIITVPNYASYCAIYPFGLGSVSGTTATLNIPQEQRYYEKDSKQVVNAPMAACTQNDPNGSITFHNLGALLAINIECNIGSSMDVMEVIVQSHSESGNPLPLWGTAEGINLISADAIYQCSTTPSSNDDPTHSTIYLRKYRVENGQEVQVKLFTLAAGESRPVYVYVPAVPEGINNYYSITVNGSNGVTKTRTQASHTGGNLSRNMMVNVPFAMRDVVAPDGAIDGKFTINANGDQVYFAQGNLQWRPTTNQNIGNPGDGVWRIAKNQYDYIGGTTVNSDNQTVYFGNVGHYVNSHFVRYSNDSINKNNYSGYIDLFGWATSGWHDNSDNYNMRYHPYDWQTTPTGNSSNQTGYGPSPDRPVTNTGNPNFLSGDYANYDWGVYNSANGGILYVDANDVEQPTTAQWRTLTMVEWGYIFSNHDKNIIFYEGVPGYILYYDGYRDNHNPVSGNVTDADFPPGCVFLPMAGKRTSAQYSEGPSSSSGKGYYWSSQSSDPNAGRLTASAVQISHSNGNGTVSTTTGQFTRNYGFSVRLVTPVQ